MPDPTPPRHSSMSEPRREQRPDVPTREADTPDESRTEDVAQRAATKEGKDPADLGGAELLNAARHGELSTSLAPVRSVRQPVEDDDEEVLAENGLPYVGVDASWYDSPDLIDERNAATEKAAKEREDS